MNPILPSLLLLVGNPLAPTPADTAVQAMLTGWGYSVRVADDDAVLSFDGVDLVYVALSVQAGAVGDRLLSCPVGVLSEGKPVLGLPGPLMAPYSAQSISIEAFVVGDTGPGHWVTSPFPLGPLVITNSIQPMRSSPLGPGRSLASRVGSPTQLSLVIFDTDEAPARRLRLPFGEGFDHASLNANGRELVRRSTKWVLGHAMLGKIGIND